MQLDPTRRPKSAAPAAATLAASLLLLAALPDAARADGRSCEQTISREVRTCFKRVTDRSRRCFLAARGPCASDDARIAGAVARLEERVRARCPDGATIAAAGHAAALTPDGLVARLREACLGEAASVAARSFGGPHGAVLARSFGGERVCLDHVMREGATLVRKSFALQSDCVRRAHRGAACDGVRLAARLVREEERARGRIEQRCTDVGELVALNATELTEAASAQARCLVAAAHGDTGPLALDCGARPAVPPPPRGVATQVVLDEATWGTRCGDGSPYAFWVRFAPAGQPAERVVIFLQGGGVCVFADQCAAVGSGLMRALDNTLSGGGILSNTNPDSPFRDWTKVYLPYCTQDLHIGGGTTNVFPSVTVHRYGGRNVRAALRWVRDALWAELDATSEEGYRPDRLSVLFSGGSAGGFGVNYNYHYLLDDLRWRNTVAVPDSGLGLDNGELIGVLGLGGVMRLESGPLAWRARPMLPPYCHVARCAVGPEIQEAHSARLEATPVQRILNVSNQVDDVQVSTTFFASRRAWIDELRRAYCATQGLTGLRYFMPAIATSMHGMVASSGRYPTIASAGTTLGDWLATAFAAPEALTDRVEEGALVATFGVQPFACPVAP